MEEGWGLEGELGVLVFVFDDDGVFGDFYDVVVIG